VGRDTIARMRDSGNSEQQWSLLMNKVWEYLKGRSPEARMDFIVFDSVLMGVFAPVLAPGASGCPGRDLQVICKQLLQHYHAKVARRA